MKKIILVAIGAMLMFACKKADFGRELPGATSKASENKLFEQPKFVPKYKEGELLVKFKSNLNRSVLGKMKAELVRTKAMERFSDNGFYKVKVDNVEAEAARFRASGEVEWVSPNWSEKILDLNPNDPYFTSGELYGMNNIHAPTAWNSGNVGSRDVYVGIIDEGIMYWHPDLCNQVWENPEEMNGIAGVDDDGNGYIDDFRGWNWFDGNNQIYFGNDDHGTHVSGTIAAKGNNGIGVIGVAPNVKIISLKFLADYGFDDNAIQAIDYAIDLKIRKHMNIKVLSNSWGGGGFNQGLIDAINRAKAADILFVVAAGNSNNNNDVNPAYGYPSAYPNDNIIAVGASDWSNAKASFSSYGKTAVDIFAPGVAVWSTLPSYTHTPTYGQYGGTSMATPHVSGAVALLASVNPEWGWSQLKSTILSTVTPVASLVNYCVSGGVLNVSTFTGVTPAIVQDPNCPAPPVMDMTPPPTPQNLRVIETTIGDPTYGNSVRLQWDTVGFAATKSYNIWMKQGTGSFTWIGSISGYWIVRVNGLALDTYQFYIVAASKWGALSGSSNIVSADLRDSFNDTEPPSIPQNLRASDIGELSFRLTWDASTDNHTTPFYRVNWRKVGNVNWTMTTTSETTFLVNVFVEPNTTYDCRIEAYDAAGNYSAPSQIVQVTTGTSQPPPPPPSYDISASLNGSSSGLNVSLNWTVSTNGTVQSVKLERKKGGSGFSEIATVTNQTSYQDQVPNPGQYAYRLKITLTNNQVGYSNEKLFKVNKR